MKSNDIEDIIRSKLRDVPMETVPHDWTAIERSLGLAPKRSVPLGRILATAVACLAALVAGGLLLLQDPAPTVSTGYSPMVSSEPLRPVVEPPALRNDPVKSSAVDVIARLKQTIDETSASRSFTTVSNVFPEAAPAEGGSRTAADPAQSVPREENRSFARQGNADRVGTRRFTVPVIPSDDPFENPRSRRGRRGSNWMLALFADGAAGTNNSRMGVRKLDNPVFANSGPGFYTTGSVNDLAASTLRTSSNSVQEVVQFDSSPVLQVTEASWNHQAPLAFGLSARKSLADRWGVELGLTYTYLLSKSSPSTGYSQYDIRQQLHYLGIPLSVTYTPLRRGNFELYGRAGGSVDFNIAGRRTEIARLNGTGSNESLPAITRFTTKTPQWSVMARLGVMYKFSPAAGVYLEPGVGHFFGNNSPYESYWTEHPTHFNLQVGVRTTF